jgi:WD domain, G-beta repeat
VPAGPAVPVNELGLQAAEERFGLTVVGVPDRSGGRCHAGVGEALGEPQRGVLRTLSSSLGLIRPRSRASRKAGEPQIWDPATGAERHTLTGHTSPVQSVVIAPDGSWLATTGDDHTARIWDPATGTRVTSSRVAGPLDYLEWNGETLIAAGAFGPFIFRLVVGQTTR